MNQQTKPIIDKIDMLFLKRAVAAGVDKEGLLFNMRRWKLTLGVREGK
jgi:hypothetical protein